MLVKPQFVELIRWIAEGGTAAAPDLLPYIESRGFSTSLIPTINAVMKFVFKPCSEGSIDVEQELASLGYSSSAATSLPGGL